MHANSDGLAMAVRAHQSAFPMGLDASDDLEIGHTFSRVGGPIALGFATTLLSAALAFEFWAELGAYERAVGCAAVLLFGLLTCRLIWMLPAERGPVVIISRYGIRDLRIGNEFLLWDSIEDVSVRESRGSKTVVLTPTPALRRQLRCVRSRRAISPGGDVNSIVIDPAGLAVDFATLLRACQACHEASERRAALQQNSRHDAQGFAVKAS